jgi:small subunit ribosomal protein S21
MRAVNAEIILEPGQDAEHACKLLKKTMLKAGIFKEMKKRSYYEPPSKRKRRKQNMARKKERKRGYLYEAARLAHLDRYGLSDDPRRPSGSR